MIQTGLEFTQSDIPELSLDVSEPVPRPAHVDLVDYIGAIVSTAELAELRKRAAAVLLQWDVKDTGNAWRLVALYSVGCDLVRCKSGRRYAIPRQQLEQPTPNGAA